jgi:putative Mn2+ efflux pump MntP
MRYGWRELSGWCIHHDPFVSLLYNFKALKYLLYTLFIAALAYNTFPLALGLNRDHRNPHWLNMILAATFGLLQGVMYHLGALLGDTFMYLFVIRFKWVVFGILVAVSIRMLLESVKIRRGARLFSFDNYIKFLIMTVAAGINTLIAGMTAMYFQPFGALMPLLLVIAGFSWSIAGVSMNLSRINILLSSALHLASSIAIFIVALVYMLTSQWL